MLYDIIILLNVITSCMTLAKRSFPLLKVTLEVKLFYISVMLKTKAFQLITISDEWSYRHNVISKFQF